MPSGADLLSGAVTTMIFSFRRSRKIVSRPDDGQPLIMLPTLVDGVFSANGLVMTAIPDSMRPPIAGLSAYSVKNITLRPARPSLAASATWWPFVPPGQADIREKKVDAGKTGSRQGRDAAPGVGHPIA
jgi:hypothetical protein